MQPDDGSGGAEKDAEDFSDNGSGSEGSQDDSEIDPADFSPDTYPTGVYPKRLANGKEAYEVRVSIKGERVSHLAFRLRKSGAATEAAYVDPGGTIQFSVSTINSARNPVACGT